MNETLLIIALALSLAGLVMAGIRARALSRTTPVTVSVEPSASPLLGVGGGEQILDHMEEGVLVVDRSLRVTYANGASKALLGLQTSQHGDVRLPSAEIGSAARRALEGSDPIEELVEAFFPARRSLKVRAVPLGDSAALVMIQDVSDEVLTQKIRREFVSHASHELKSPVASLQALAEAMHQAIDASDHESAQRFSSKVLSELARMSKLVNDLLDLSRLEDPAALPEDPCNLGAVARKEIGRLEEAAHTHELRFIPHIDPEVWVRGDPQQLALLIRNLVENAIQYTPSGGTVSVDVKAAGLTACIRVADDGMGIPLESQARVFERFYRVDRARSRDRGGTGLGLAIVKHVVELHGGTIDLHSELGSGSTFTVRFPLIEEDPTERRAEKESA